MFDGDRRWLPPTRYLARTTHGSIRGRKARARGRPSRRDSRPACLRIRCLRRLAAFDLQPRHARRHTEVVQPLVARRHDRGQILRRWQSHLELLEAGGELLPLCLGRQRRRSRHLAADRRDAAHGARQRSLRIAYLLCRVIHGGLCLGLQILHLGDRLRDGRHLRVQTGGDDAGRHARRPAPRRPPSAPSGAPGDRRR